MEIVVPDPSLVILCGPAASGKTAFARRHFRETQVVSSDRCRAMLCDDEAEQAASQSAFELVHSIVDKRLLLGRLTVADSTALAAEARRALREIAAAHGVPGVLVGFEAPLADLVRRDAERGRRVGREVLEMQLEKFARAKEEFAQEGYAAWWLVGPQDRPVVSLRRSR